LLVEEFSFAKAKSPRPVKSVITGPYTLARHSIEENGGAGGFGKLLAAYTVALAEEIKALAQAGTTLIQVEEPSLLKHPGDFSCVAESLATLAANKEHAQLALVVYFGDAAPLYEQLQTLPVDILGLDFTYSPSLVDTVASQGTSKTLALGLLDGRNTRLEEPSTVAKQVERLTRGASPASVYLNPSCGLEYLPRDRARLKLQHLSRVKKTFLGSSK
jgi:5-methyltetrahydropteroyltriglutamate--homocysteine methyltransferase